MTSSCNAALVTKLFNVFILGIILKISLEVVTVLLFLFGHRSEEESVVVDSALASSLLHSALTTCVSFRIAAELSGIELLNAVENSIELGDALLDFIPGFVKITSIGHREQDALASHLTVNFLVCLMHGIKLLMSFLQALQLVGRVNQNTVSFI